LRVLRSRIFEASRRGENCTNSGADARKTMIGFRRPETTASGTYNFPQKPGDGTTAST